jgi:hypothetical protein
MISVGAAHRVINNEIGAYVQAATHRKRATRIRDDCEANALYLSDGGSSLLLISCDLAALENDAARAARDAVSAVTGIPARCVIIAGTHMHSGPSLVPTCYGKTRDDAYVERLRGWLADLAAEAVAGAQPGRLAWGLGEARIGHNRRCCWADGTHSMHGDTTRADFTGLEGPDDPAHLAIFAQDEAGRPLAVFYNNTTHPTNFYGADFYSADFPGVVRQNLRAALGPVAVLFFNGAFGDISMQNMLDPAWRAETAELRMARIAHLLTGETLRLLYGARFHEAPVLGHAWRDLEVPVRLPDEADVRRARDCLARADAGEEVPDWDVLFAYGTVLLHERFHGDPVERLAVHAVRIGEVALVTQPCELYCQFGLDIKRRSPAALTAVCGNADGHAGYCPTLYGVLGGGYSGRPIYSARLAPQAGYVLVDEAARLLNELWRST